MAFDQRRTYLCYNNRDLIRDGFIPLRIQKEYIPVNTFNLNRAKNPAKGVSYNISKDKDGNVTQVVETRKLLPASKIKIEIDFSKVMKSAVTNPFQPGSLGFSPLANMIATPIIAPMGFGGITEGLTEITYHLLDAETKINQKVTVTKEMIDSGIYECDGYPLSVFGIVKESNKEETDEEGVTIVNKIGLDFTDEQKDVLGKFNNGVWKGTRRKRIDGATDSNGLFGGKGEEEVLFEDVAQSDQEQLFVKIVRDDRKVKFRADNSDASGSKAYPFRIIGSSSVDATDKQIRIKIQDEVGNPIITAGDNIYLTYSFASKRRVRQTLTHMGRIGQGNTYGTIGFIGAIASEANIFDYQICTWKVPVLPTTVAMAEIDTIADVYDEDDYKLEFRDYKEIKEKEKDNEDYDPTESDCDEIEGWRLSQAITTDVEKFWTADYRGILLYDNREVEVVLPRSDIRDSEWFTKYLEGLSFTSPTGPEDTYLALDLVKNMEDEIDLDDETGQLFDISESVNSYLFDREKIPYYRPFALALKNVSRYDLDNDGTGIGIIHLDFTDRAGGSGIPTTHRNLELFDLSFADFRFANAQPVNSFSCEEIYDIKPHHYFSENYDAQNEGPGAWYDRGHLESEIFEWRPAGSSIESYWKQETPYFCGDFTRKSRVYIERMGGNSLDNYSWVYIDTYPFVPSNISLDMNQYKNDAFVVFRDEELHRSLSYHKLKDAYLYGNLKLLTQDITQNHIKEDYDYEKYRIKGYNRILGDRHSFSNGAPITDDINRICYNGLEEEFWWTEEIYPGTVGYGLDFSDDIPTATLPDKWYIRQLILKYNVKDTGMVESDRKASFYFEDTDVSIDDVTIPFSGDNDTFTIDFKYYYGTTLKFFGPAWSNINVTNVSLRLTSPDNPNGKRHDLKDYKIDSEQSSVVNDGVGKTIVFYSDIDGSGINAAVTYDDGNKWIVHKGIVRLIENETASLPFVVKGEDSQYLHLFYVLNDIFLMHKMINTNDFIDSDSFVDPIIPESYEEGDYNSDSDNPEVEYWGNFSYRGHNIRKSPSYFVAGDETEQFFQDQLEILDDLNASNSSISDIKKQQSPRFIFSGNRDDSEMKDGFEGKPYAAYIDNEGTARVFILVDNKLSIKRSTNFATWKYDVQEVEIHKNYVDPDVNRGIIIEIQNIQLMRNDHGTNLLVVLYFHDNMLFMRRFNTDLLYPTYDISGNQDDTLMKAHLELTSSSTNKPIFVLGKMPAALREKKIEEIDGGVAPSDSELLLDIPYSKSEVEKFDENFDIDSDTQPFGYVTSRGLARILYKNSLGSLSSVVVDSFRESIPEIWFVNKETS